jgi:cob(I)alamin adenosyltransferase
MPKIELKDIQLLEDEMDRMSIDLPEMTNFILPGGHTIVSYCHVARTVCRRCERLVVELASDEIIDALIIQYLNRLSDYLFVLSRKITQDLGVKEALWKPKM